VRLHVDILEGRTESQVEHWVGVKHADLVLIGRGKGGFDETVLIKRLVRHLPVSVMAVPVDAEPAIGRILVPVDFSEQSAKAMFRAGELVDRLDDVTMQIFHAFEIPPGHFKISRTAKQFEHIMQENSGEVLDKFLTESDAMPLRENAVLVPANHSNPARDIQDYLVEHPVDLVLIGSHGHGTVERFFIGSVTEGMLERSSQTAILVIK
jgi:nucleotide-binding universal stress UspA family protein